MDQQVSEVFIRMKHVALGLATLKSPFVGLDEACAN